MKRWKRHRPLLVPPTDQVITEAQTRWDAGDAVVAVSVWPRLRVWHDRYSLRCRWDWHITAPNGAALATGTAPTHGEALAVGMAHLAVCSAAWAVDELGATLPPGWERAPSRAAHGRMSA